MKAQSNPSFMSFDKNKEGLLFDDSEAKDYPVKYWNFIGYGHNGLQTQAEDSYYVYVYEGKLFLQTENGVTQDLYRGMYSTASGSIDLQGKGKAIIVQVVTTKEGTYYHKNAYRSMTLYGGPIEHKGRLKYIDGCTDSLLLAPVRFGDPCLNYLHFPKDIDQTPHTHPSHRIGIVARGSGLCKTPFGNVDLTEGMIFIIKRWDQESISKGLDGKEYPDGTHSFQTFDQEMDVIAFHPDSDFGATDEVHPMINRTIIDGKSASQIEGIQTK